MTRRRAAGKLPPVTTDHLPPPLNIFPEQPAEEGLRPIGGVAEQVAAAVPAAIPTTYKGVTYRSRTEARWAVFFDVLGVSAEWEPEGYQLGDIRYLPDFYIPAWKIFVEIKGEYPTPFEREKARRLADATGKPVWLVIGPPDRQEGLIFWPTIDPDHELGAGGAWINRCRRCDALVLGYEHLDSHGNPFAWGQITLTACGRTPDCTEKFPGPKVFDEQLKLAMDAARNERFGVHDGESQKGAA